MVWNLQVLTDEIEIEIEIIGLLVFRSQVWGRKPEGRWTHRSRRSVTQAASAHLRTSAASVYKQHGTEEALGSFVNQINRHHPRSAKFITQLLADWIHRLTSEHGEGFSPGFPPDTNAQLFTNTSKGCKSINWWTNPRLLISKLINLLVAELSLWEKGNKVKLL